MFKIEEIPSGYLLTFKGQMDRKILQQWYDESVELLKNSPPSFGVIVDMREIDPITSDGIRIILKGQLLYRENGLMRSAVILNNKVTTYQLKQIAQHTGISWSERYLFADEHENWLEVATAWVDRGVEPGK